MNKLPVNVVIYTLNVLEMGHNHSGYLSKWYYIESDTSFVICSWRDMLFDKSIFGVFSPINFVLTIIT